MKKIECGPDPESIPSQAEILELEIYKLIDEDNLQALMAREEEEDE